MADMSSLDQIARLAASLRAPEWEKLGGRADLSPAELKKRLRETFGDDYVHTLWARHQGQLAQLAEVHRVLTDSERERLGEVAEPADLAQKALETFDAKLIQDLKNRLESWRPAAPGVSVSGYDFRHPARVSIDQIRALESLHDNFARLLGSTLSGAMRQVVDVDTAFVDQTTYAEYVMSLSNPACSYSFDLGPTKGKAVLDFALPIVFGVVDRTFGGKGSSRGVEARPLSRIEFPVMAGVVKRTIQNLEATWEPIQRVEISNIELETNPEFLQIAPGSEVVLLLAFEVNTEQMSGLVSLCYPFFTLEPILPRLGQQTYQGLRGRQNRQQRRAVNRLRLGAVDLPAVVEVGRARIPAAAARQLRVGDVVRLETRADEPARVYLGGKPKFLGFPCADEGQLKVQIAGRVPAQLAHRYGTVSAVSEPRAASRGSARVLPG